MIIDTASWVVHIKDF